MYADHPDLPPFPTGRAFGPVPCERCHGDAKLQVLLRDLQVWGLCVRRGGGVTVEDSFSLLALIRVLDLLWVLVLVLILVDQGKRMPREIQTVPAAQLVVVGADLALLLDQPWTRREGGLLTGLVQLPDRVLQLLAGAQGAWRTAWRRKRRKRRTSATHPTQTRCLDPPVSDYSNALCFSLPTH